MHGVSRMTSTPTVAIVATGSELLSGHGLDTNSAHISSSLSELGFTIVRHESVGDERAALVEAIERGMQYAKIVITTGSFSK